jgi:hypothetical protein
MVLQSPPLLTVGFYILSCVRLILYFVTILPHVLSSATLCHFLHAQMKEGGACGGVEGLQLWGSSDLKVRLILKRPEAIW